MRHSIGLAILLTIPILAGCQSSPYLVAGLHAADTIQTFRVAQTPGCYETDPITRALIGEKPSTAQVALWSVGVSLAYSYLRSRLSDEWQPRLDWLAIGVKGWQVAENYRNGIPLTGDVSCK